MNILAQKKCMPCKKGEKSLGFTEAKACLEQIPEWEFANSKAIFRSFKFKNFADSLAFVNKISDIAESENHHPDIKFGWGYVEVTFTTHNIEGLHENDFIMAAKVSKIANST